MADLKITDLNALAEAGIQATDPLAIADVSATETKKVTVKDLIAAGVALIDDADIPGAKVGTLGTDQVATAAIQANAVTAAKIASGTITATQIADATITGAKLVNDTVTATQIAANAITASELADNAVDTAAIAANAVTTAKITDANVTYAKLSLSDGDIPGAKIATGGITATQLAANSVAASELADDAVDTAAIVDGAVTAVKIATNTITANQIAANAIGASELADNAVDTAAIADGSVTAAKLSGTLGSSSIADSAITTAKIADDAVTSAKLAANAVDATALADNAVDSGAIASTAVTEAKIASSAVTNAKIADATITPAKLNTSNLDRSLNVASGNLGINNVVSGGAATRSGITYNAQGLITGTVALAAADLPVATTSAVGGVSIGTGLTVSGAGALSLTNSITGATISGITYNAQGMITATTALVAGDLPVATTSAKGAVQITSGGGLTVDGSGNLTTSTSGISAGTYQSITVNNKGVATAGAALTAALIPDLAASKITSGSFDAARIQNDSIDGTKLSNSSTAIFQSIAQSGYPTAQFTGQILYDTVSDDAFIWDGNAWQAITTLTKGSLVFGGNFNASTSKMTACSTAGLAAGLAVGSNLPTPSATTDGLYVVVDTAGTPASPAPVVSLSPPDYILGVTNTTGSSWNEIDLSQTVAGQVASNITFTPYGQLSSTNVQDALQEVETEKLALTGGTVTGQILIGNTGSLVFEGSTIDAYETTITVADPTSSDKTITFPDTTGTVITSGDTGTVTGTMIANDTIQNVDIKSDAAIAFSKLAALTSAQILVGNGSNVVTGVAVTGDIGINNAGLTSITAGAIVNADINASAAIAGSKITTGTTSAVGVLQLTDAADSTSTTTAATPAAVKIAKDAADAAATTANAALPKAGGTMTGNLILDNAKELRLSEGDSDGANYTGLKAQAQTGDITLTLPAVAPTAGQVLKADASTPTTLTWAADSATDSTKMPLAGGTFTGDVTFTGDSSNGLWDKSASAFVANLTGNVTGNVTGDLTGTADLATQVTVSANNSTDETVYPLFVDGATGSQGAETDTGLTYNPSSGLLTSTSFAGALTGNVTGNVSGTAATVTGAAQSAITSVGTLTGLTVSGDVSIADKIVHTGDTNTALRFPAADTFSIETGGSERARVDSSGRLLVGTNTASSSGASNNAFLSVAGNGASATGEGQLNLWKKAAPAAGDTLGLINFAGDIGEVGALIKGEADLAWDQGGDTSDHAGRLIFSTTADNDSVPTERMRIDSSGRVGIGTGTINRKLVINEASAESVVQITNGTSGVGADDGFQIIHFTSGATQLLNRENGALSLHTNNTTALTLDTSQNATFAGDVDLADDKKLLVGTGDDLQIYHDSSDNNSYIKESGAGNLYIYSENLRLENADGSKSYIEANNGGAVEIFHDNDRQLYTTATGIIVGDADHADVRLRIDHEDNTGSGGLKINAFGTASIELLSNFSGSADGGVPSGAFGLTTSHAKDIHICTNGASRMTIASGGAVTCSGTVSDSKGNLRSIPQNQRTAAYTLAASDAGKHIYQTSNGDITVPPDEFNVGDAITIISSNSTDTFQILQGTGVTIYHSAEGNTTGNRTLAGKGMCTLINVSSNVFFISGSGLS